MNNGTHIVKNKKVYAVRDLCRPLQRYFINRGGLTKLRLKTPEGADFVRWEIEGPKDVIGGIYGKSCRFQEMARELKAIFGEDLVRVCRLVQSKHLVLDMKTHESIFRKDIGELTEFIDKTGELPGKAPFPNIKLTELYWWK